MMLLHSPLSWALVQHTVAPLTAVVLLTAAAVPEPPAPQVVADPAADHAAAATLDAAAIELAHELRAVPADDTDRLCARDDLRVSWTEPAGFEHGAHVGTIGPAPDADTVEVNGAVVCGNSTWAYMGFEAQRRSETEWQVNAVPYLEESHGRVASLNLDADPEPHGEGECQRWGRPPAFPCHAADRGPDDTGEDAHDHTHEHGSGTPAQAPAPSPSTPTGRVAQSEWLAGLGPIEPYAAYEPQRSCSPTAKAGMSVVRDTLLGTHPRTRNLGIVRACHIGGRSEHKEGRAFDWGAYVTRPVEKAAVDRFLTQLFATDADGNTHALARRMGVMYVVWNGQIWASHRAQEGWRRYHGPNPHVDHIHISLSWAGGLGQTSFFTQNLAGKGVLGLVPPGGSPLATDGAPVASVPVADQEPTSPPSDTTSAPAPTSGETSGSTRDDGTGDDDRKDGSTKDDGTKDGPRSDPSPGPSPSPSPGETEAEHARREAEDEQRRIEEEQRRLEEKQREAEERELQRLEEQQRREEERQRRAEEREAEQQAASSRGSETDTAPPGKGNGGGKGGGKGKR